MKRLEYIRLNEAYLTGDVDRDQLTKNNRIKQTGVERATIKTSLKLKHSTIDWLRDFGLEAKHISAYECVSYLTHSENDHKRIEKHDGTCVFVKS